MKDKAFGDNKSKPGHQGNFLLRTQSMLGPSWFLPLKFQLFLVGSGYS